MKKSKDNEFFYKSILFDSPLGYAYHKIILDDKGNPCDYQFLEVNAAFEKLTGLSSKNIIGKNITEILPEISKDPANWISVYGEVAINNVHKRFIDFSKPLQKWYNVDAFSPKKNYFIVLITDVTEIKKQQEKLEELLEQRHLIFSKNSANMLMIESDTGKIFQANPSAIDFYGYTEEELLSKSVWDLNIQSKEEVQSLMKKATERKQNSFTLKHRLKSGEIKDVDVYSSPIPYKNRTLLFSIIIDVTEREESVSKIKNAEKELKNSQLLLRASLNSPKNIIILSLDKNYNYLYFNNTHKQVMKYTYNANVEVGRCIFDYISNAEDIEKSKRNYSKALKGQAHVTRETYGDIIIKTYETYYNPIKDDDGNIIGVSAYARDISEITEAYKNLENEKLTAQKYLDIAGVMILLLDKKGNIQLLNRKGYSILNVEKNDIIGKNWFDEFIPEDIKEEVKKAFKEVVNTPNKFDTLDYENPIIDSKGNLKDIFWYNTKLYDTDGNIIGVLCSGEDITEQKIAVENLKKSEERFRKLFEKAPFGYQSLDENGCFIDVNDKWLEIFGYEKNEVIGKWFGDLLLDDTKNRFKERFETFKKNGNIHSEFPMITQDGNVISVAFDGNISYNNNHQFMRTHCTVSDVTEINIANEKLRASEKKLSMIIANVEEAIYGVDIKENCTFVNQSFLDLLGYQEDEVIGKNMHELIHHSYSDGTEFPASKCPMRKAFKSGEKVRIELDYLWKKNGEKIPVEYSSNPLFNGDTLIGAVVTFKDISKNIEHLRELEYSSYHDFLTNLYNRRFYSEKLNELNKSKKYPFAILNFDVNGLKTFNDVYGHETGDEVLKIVSKEICSIIPNEEVVARVSGDEFAAIMPNATKKNMNILINDISEKISKISVKNISISIAAGYYIKANDDITLEEAQKFAEDDMLKAKISEKSSYRNKAIQAIFKTLTEKYEEEKIHSQRVSSISVSIGKALKMEKPTIKLLETAALYHDIGKISIADSIIKKPGRLTNEEFKIIKTHTEIGYQILNTADQFSDLAKHALYHHERWDGKGYPRGLKGENIPLISRIIGVADAFEAMTADRVYRQKMPNDQAIKEIVMNSGTQFDPNIAKVFIEKVLRKHWEDYM